MPKLLRLPPPPDASRAKTERTRTLFDWATMVLREIGLAKDLALAASIEELRHIAFDADDPAIPLAVRDAVYPANGQRLDHFRGLREGALKRILRNRFDDMKQDREKVLRGCAGATGRDWTDDLILDPKDRIVPNLANLILILRNAPKWQGYLLMTSSPRE